MRGPEEQKFEEALKKHINEHQPPAAARTAVEWAHFDKTEEGKLHNQRREEAREDFYRQMNEHIARGVFQLADLPPYRIHG